MLTYLCIKIFSMNFLIPAALIIALLACHAPKNQSASNSYTPTQQDSVYAHVFKPWDGNWKGTFTIYLDSLGQKTGTAQPRIQSKAALDSLPLIQDQVIQVEQTYTSINPFYQTVEIQDTYMQNGAEKTVNSKGYNQVKNGEMICVVNKPAEQVVHEGTSLPDSTIIWERSLKDPTQIEYFYEQVSDNTYYIIGWGYYGDDDPRLTPRMWFYGEYQRSE